MKKLMVSALLVAAVLMAKAEGYQYLYWQVQPDTVANDVRDYNAAYLYVLDGDEVKAPLGVTGWDTTQTASARTASPIVGTVDLSGYAAYSFLWELVFWDGAKSTIVGTSDLVAFSALQDYLVSAPEGSEIPSGVSVYSPSSFSAVSSIPEPASGVLLLFGLAGLALRRKRM